MDGASEAHLADGRRVALSELAGSQADFISVGADLRLAPAARGFVFSSGAGQTTEIRLASGRSVRLSMAARLLTGRGWAPVGEVAIGTRVALIRQLPELNIRPYGQTVVLPSLGS